MRTSTSKLFMLALLAAVSGAGYAQSTVTLYGLLDAGVDATRAGKGTSKRQLSGGSTGSRWGLRASEDLGGGLRVIAILEGGLNVDDGTLAQGGRGFGREATVSLAGSFGTFSLGRMSLPIYKIGADIDAFYLRQGGGLTALTKSGATSQQPLPLLATARLDNAAQWTSPIFANTEIRLMVAAGEGQATLGRAYSGSVRYQTDAMEFLVAAARQESGTSGNGTGFVQSLMVGGNYDLGPARVYAGVTSERNSCATCTGALTRISGVSGSRASAFRMINLGFRVPIGDYFTLIPGYTRVQDRSEYTIDPGNRDANWFSLGSEYRLSKRTILYGGVTTINNRNGSLYALGTGTSQQPANVVGPGNPRSTTGALGIVHSF